MTLDWPEGVRQKVKHRLDPARISQTAENLALRVSESLPESTLAGLAVELAGVARATEDRTRQASRPIYALRAASLLAVVKSLRSLVSCGPYPRTMGLRHDLRGFRIRGCRFQPRASTRRCALVSHHARSQGQAQEGTRVPRGTARVHTRHRRDTALLHTRPL